MWIQITQTSGNESFFNCSDGTSSDNKLVLMYNTGSAKIEAKYRSGGTSTVAEHSIAGDDITGLGWFHLAMTYNTSTPLIQLFLNGARVAQITSSFTQMSEDVAIDRVRLGSNSNADNTYHHGNIDEFIYIAGKDLTESEMLLLYNNGKPDDIGDLPSAIFNAIKCWLRFGEGSIDGSADQTSVIFDMSNNSLGSEKIVNGGFDSDTTWSKTNATIDNGVATITVPDGGAYSAIFQSEAAMVGSLTSGEAYRLRATLNGTSGKQMRFQDDANNNGGLTAANGVVTLTGQSQDIEIFWIANSNSNGLNIARNTGEPYSFTIDNVSVKEVQGNFGFCVANSTVGIVNVP